MKQARKLSAVFLTAVMALSFAAIAQAKKAKQETKQNTCAQDCKTAKTVALEGCKTKTGDAKSSCEKATKAKFKKCKESCPK